MVRIFIIQAHDPVIHLEVDDEQYYCTVLFFMGCFSRVGSDQKITTQHIKSCKFFREYPI